MRLQSAHFIPLLPPNTLFSHLMQSHHFIRSCDLGVDGLIVTVLMQLMCPSTCSLLHPSSLLQNTLNSVAFSSASFLWISSAGASFNLVHLKTNPVLFRQIFSNLYCIWNKTQYAGLNIEALSSKKKRWSSSSNTVSWMAVSFISPNCFIMFSCFQHIQPIMFFL